MRRSGNVVCRNRTWRNIEMAKYISKSRETSGMLTGTGTWRSRRRSTILMAIMAVMLLLGSIGLQGGAWWSSGGTEVSVIGSGVQSEEEEAVKAVFGKLPLSFEPN